MELPELVYGDNYGLIKAMKLVEAVFDSSSPSVYNLCQLGHGLKKRFYNIEPLLDKFTMPVCAKCPTGCCVNSHGFPDFEDLIFFKSIGLSWLKYDMSKPEHGLCQFLGPIGCSLPRFNRSYRCTWYFCNSLLDTFEKIDNKSFMLFDEQLYRMGLARNSLIDMFKHLL